MPTRNSSPVLLTAKVDSKSSFFAALASALRLPQRASRPAPGNLDDMADLLREAGVDRIICSHCLLAEPDERALRQVFSDLGIAWVR